MTKEQLAKFGIIIETEEVSDEEGYRLIKEALDNAKAGETKAKEDYAKVKGLNDTYSSQIAEMKKKEQANMSEEEKRNVKMAELEQQVKDSQRKLAVQSKKASLVAMGYDEETAEKYANDELDGKDTLQYQKDFMAKRETELRAKILKEGQDPKGNGGDPNNAKFTQENFKKGLISVEELNQLKAKDPVKYREVLGLPAEDK